MASQKNPFQVLGLNAGLIVNLNDREVSLLVDAQFESLRKLYHPDRAGRSEKKRVRNEEMFKELSKAHDLLDRDQNPRLYEHYKKKLFHQKPFQKQVSELENELSIALTRENVLYVRTLDYLKNFHLPEDPVDGFNVFDFPSGSIYLMDSVVSMYRGLIENTDDLFYLLNVNEDGSFTQVRRKRKNNNSQQEEFFNKEIKTYKRLVGTVDASLVRKHHTNFKRLLNTFQYTQSITDAEMAKITSNRSSRDFNNEHELFNNQIIPERFKEAMLLMTPRLQPYSYLFSLNKNANGIYFSLEGEILGVKKDDQVYQGAIRQNDLFPENKSGI
jgi:hypothetical protein